MKFLNPVLNPDIASQKESIVDVLCRDSKGIQTIVEMQVARTTGFEKRAQYYAAGAYFSQAYVGGKYQDLKEVIFIAITDFVLFPEDSEHISTHHILNIKTYRHYLKDFKFVFIELPKFTKTKEDQLENIFEKWCYFFSATRKVMVLWWLNSIFPDIRDNVYLTYQRVATFGMQAWDKSR